MRLFSLTNFITDWQKAAIFNSQMNAKRLHTSPASGKSIGFLQPDVNLKGKTPAFILEKFIIDSPDVALLR